jgi:hypothetical protein
MNPYNPWTELLVDAHDFYKYETPYMDNVKESPKLNLGRGTMSQLDDILETITVANPVYELNILKLNIQKMMLSIYLESLDGDGAEAQGEIFRKLVNEL